MYGQSTSSSGTYDFQLLELPSTLDSPDINVLEGSAVTTGTVDYRSLQVRTLEGSPGQTLFLNGIEGRGTAFTLYSPAGTPLFATEHDFGANDHGPFTLTESQDSIT